jgi:hypothetical protein
MLPRACRNTPYAFWHLPLSNLPDGYPVFFDINLSQVRPSLKAEQARSRASCV